jgi:hypothetical protein
MPAYSFKERFVPMVVDGSKPHTVRSRRKYPAKVGDPVSLFFGMRTKWCKRLRDETCLRTCSIFINDEAFYMFSGLLSNEYSAAQFGALYTISGLSNKEYEGLNGDKVTCKSLLLNECNRFAWLDGFRPEGSTLENPIRAWTLMHRYWSANGDIPFLGDVIYWSLAYEK